MINQSNLTQLIGMTMHSKLVIPLTNLEFQKWEEKKNQHSVKG